LCGHCFSVLCEYKEEEEEEENTLDEGLIQEKTGVHP
jgi:hypothetical protein